MYPEGGNVTRVTTRPSRHSFRIVRWVLPTFVFRLRYRHTLIAVGIYSLFGTGLGDQFVFERAKLVDQTAFHHLVRARFQSSVQNVLEIKKSKIKHAPSRNERTWCWIFLPFRTIPFGRFTVVEKSSNQLNYTTHTHMQV